MLDSAPDIALAPPHHAEDGARPRDVTLAVRSEGDAPFAISLPPRGEAEGDAPDIASPAAGSTLALPGVAATAERGFRTLALSVLIHGALVAGLIWFATPGPQQSDIQLTEVEIVSDMPAAAKEINPAPSAAEPPQEEKLAEQKAPEPDKPREVASLDLPPPEPPPPVSALAESIPAPVVTHVIPSAVVPPKSVVKPIVKPVVKRKPAVEDDDDEDTPVAKLKPKPAARPVASAPARDKAVEAQAHRPQPARPASVVAPPRLSSPPPSWIGQVVARLQRAKQYPSAARDRGESGRAVVRFTLTRSGGVGGVSLASSSGSSVLDRAALETVRRAAPFPPFPEGFTAISHTISAPMSFTLN